MILTLRFRGDRGILVDEHGQQPPTGTVIGLHGSPHVGIIGYDEWGQQCTAHNSKERRRGVVTLPEEFNDFGRFTVHVIQYPVSVEHGERIWQNALADVGRGVRWFPHDNCQDFVSRAVTDHNGSPSRDAVIGIGLLVAAACVAGAALSKQ
jgi:hypothetical protein